MNLSLRGFIYIERAWSLQHGDRLAYARYLWMAHDDPELLDIAKVVCGGMKYQKPEEILTRKRIDSKRRHLHCFEMHGFWRDHFWGQVKQSVSQVAQSKHEEPLFPPHKTVVLFTGSRLLVSMSCNGWPWTWSLAISLNSGASSQPPPLLTRCHPLSGKWVSPDILLSIHHLFLR